MIWNDLSFYNNWINLTDLWIVCPKMIHWPLAFTKMVPKVLLCLYIWRLFFTVWPILHFKPANENFLVSPFPHLSIARYPIKGGSFHPFILWVPMVGQALMCAGGYGESAIELGARRRCVKQVFKDMQELRGDERAFQESRETGANAWRWEHNM